MEHKIDQYLQLIEKYPELFRPVESYRIITERDTLIRYARETGTEIGLVLDNSPFTLVIADLVKDSNGCVFRYARVVPASGKSGGAVVLPVWKNDRRDAFFGLLRNDRHAPRREAVFELPRGHLELGCTSEETAVRELVQEIGVDPIHIRAVRYLGDAHPDTGLTASLVSFYQIDLDGPQPGGNILHEGIRAIDWVSEPTFREMLADGTISCGFTHTAYLKYLLTQTK